MFRPRPSARSCSYSLIITISVLSIACLLVVSLFDLAQPPKPKIAEPLVLVSKSDSHNHSTVVVDPSVPPTCSVKTQSRIISLKPRQNGSNFDVNRSKRFTGIDLDKQNDLNNKLNLISDPDIDIGTILEQLDVAFDLQGNPVDPRTGELLTKSSSSSSLSSPTLTARDLLKYIDDNLFDPSEVTLGEYKTSVEDYFDKRLDRFATAGQNESVKYLGAWRPTACLQNSTMNCRYLSTWSDGPIENHGEWLNNRKQFPNHCCVVASQGRWSRPFASTIFDDMRKLIIVAKRNSESESSKTDIFSFYDIFRDRIAQPLHEFASKIRYERRRYPPGTVTSNIDFIATKLHDQDPTDNEMTTLLLEFIETEDDRRKKAIFNLLFRGFGRTEHDRTKLTEKFNDDLFGFLGSRDVPLYQAKMMLLLSFATLKKVDLPVLLPKQARNFTKSGWTTSAGDHEFQSKPTIQKTRRFFIHGNSFSRGLLSSLVAIMRQQPIFYDREHRGISRYVVTNLGDYMWFHNKQSQEYSNWNGDIVGQNVTMNLYEPFRLSHPEEVVLLDFVYVFHCCTEFDSDVLRSYATDIGLKDRLDKIHNFTNYSFNYNEKIAAIPESNPLPRVGGKFTTAAHPHLQRPLIHNRKHFFGGSDFSVLLYRPLKVIQMQKIETDFGVNTLDAYAKYAVENFLNYDYSPGTESSKNIDSEKSENAEEEEEEEEAGEGEDRFAAVLTHAYQQYQVNRRYISDNALVKTFDELMDLYENKFWRKHFLFNFYANVSVANQSRNGSVDAADDSEDDRRERERLKKLTRRRIFIPPPLPSENFLTADEIGHTACIIYHNVKVYFTIISFRFQLFLIN